MTTREVWEAGKQLALQRMIRTTHPARIQHARDSHVVWSVSGLPLYIRLVLGPQGLSVFCTGGAMDLFGVDEIAEFYQVWENGRPFRMPNLPPEHFMCIRPVAPLPDAEKVESFRCDVRRALRVLNDCTEPSDCDVWRGLATVEMWDPKCIQHPAASLQCQAPYGTLHYWPHAGFKER